MFKRRKRALETLISPKILTSVGSIGMGSVYSSVISLSVKRQKRSLSQRNQSGLQWFHNDTVDCVTWEEINLTCVCRVLVCFRHLDNSALLFLLFTNSILMRLHSVEVTAFQNSLQCLIQCFIWEGKKQFLTLLIRYTFLISVVYFAC